MATLLVTLQPPPFRVAPIDEHGHFVESWNRFFLSAQAAIVQILAAKPSQLVGMGMLSLQDTDAVDDLALLSAPITGRLQGAFTQGSVIFAGAGGLLTEDNAQFFWDDTNFRLGIGTNLPGTSLDIATMGATDVTVRAGGAANRAQLILQPTGNSIAYISYGNTSGNTLRFFNQKTGAPNAGIGMDLDASSNLAITGNLGVAAAAIASSALATNAAITAAATAGYQMRMLGSLTAAANNDSLYGIYINPSYATGGFTGVVGYGIRIFDVAGLATNYAIFTGAGLVRLGGDTSTQGQLSCVGAFTASSTLLCSGTSTFSDRITMQRATTASDLLHLTSITGTSTVYQTWNNTGGQSIIGNEGSVGGEIFPGATPYAFAIGTTYNAPIKFGTNNATRFYIHPGGFSKDTTDPGAGNIRITGAVLTGKATTYNNVATVGLGVPAIYGLDNRTGLTAADGAATTLYTTVAANTIFRISADIFATAAVTGTATYTIAWTENTTAQTMVVTATVINTLGTQSNLIRPDNATTITAQLTGTFTGTFTVVGLVEQIA